VVISWFPKICASKWVNLCRYAEDDPRLAQQQLLFNGMQVAMAGPYKLNPVDPPLESAWFQPFSLSK
jgi:hypothetical protein